jgi:hypothetical protein
MSYLWISRKNLGVGPVESASIRLSRSRISWCLVQSLALSHFLGTSLVEDVDSHHLLAGRIELKSHTVGVLAHLRRMTPGFNRATIFE